MSSDVAAPVEVIRAFLKDRDEPCPRCGYNLRGLQGAQCPECHEDVVLSVKVVEPKLHVYLAAVIGLAVGVGFCGLSLPLLIYQNGLRGSWNPFTMVLVVGLSAEAPLMTFLLRGRSSFLRMSTSRQVSWAVGCWTWTVVAVGWFWWLVS